MAREDQIEVHSMHQISPLATRDTWPSSWVGVTWNKEGQNLAVEFLKTLKKRPKMASVPLNATFYKPFIRNENSK